MSDDEIRVAIAKRHIGSNLCYCGLHWVQSDGSSCGNKVPDFPNDLNAIRAAILSQSEEFQDRFDEALKNSGKWIASMTAREWCDIFISLCKDNPTPERSESK